VSRGFFGPRGLSHERSKANVGIPESPEATRFCAPGIYAVICGATGNAYVGASRDCNTRLAAHRAALRAQTHPNKKLLFEWNAHGELSFGFKFVERVPDVGKLSERERHWIAQIGTLNARGRPKDALTCARSCGTIG